MASIYKRGKTWTANVFVMKDGERRRKTKSGFRTKSEAQGWANETEVAKQKHAITFNTKTPFPIYFDNWFEIYKKPFVTYSTIKWYELTSKHLHSAFENVTIENMTRARFQKFLNDMGKKYAIETTKKIKMHVHQMVVSAISEDVIVKDFTQGTNTTGIAGKDSNLKFLEADTMKLLVGNLVSRPVGERPVTDMMILMGLHTGCRYSEIAALEWTDIDFTGNIISINKTWDSPRKLFKPTKTKTSTRKVDVPDVLIKDLTEWYKLNQNTTFVFTGSNNYPPTNEAANKQLTRNLKEIHSDKMITFHGLRHTHASWLLSQGVDVKYVSERLGHSSIDITLSVYTHLLQTQRNDQTNKSMALLNNL